MMNVHERSSATIANSRVLVPLVLFILFFLLVPVRQMQPDLTLGLRMMPGDLGDGRLNNYFLENIYQFIIGRSSSLWNLGMFWPFPYLGGFSDNLFGASPVYLVARFLGFEADTSFQIWFLFGYVANFVATYFVLSRLGFSNLSASFGAALFTFAIPVSGHAAHAQLQYRFGVPLSVFYLLRFLDQGGGRNLWLSAAWLVWQFYCGIYIGFFNLLLLLVVAGFHIALDWSAAWDKVSVSLQGAGTLGLKRRQALAWLGAWLVLLALMLLLFYPYVQVTRIYGLSRGWNEISGQLPRPQSYVLADNSWIWSHLDERLFSSLTNRYEHQMLPSVVGMALVVIAAFMWRRLPTRFLRLFLLMLLSLCCLVILTIYVNNFSPWQYFYWLPLASAIRAMTRVVFVLLLPLSVISAIVLDSIFSGHQRRRYLAISIVLGALLAELAATSMPVTEKSDWRQRLSAKLQEMPETVPDGTVLFFASPLEDGKSYKTELDALWAAIILGHKTMNGYSGSSPPGTGYGTNYSVDCSVIPQRIISFLAFDKSRLSGANDYADLMAQVEPVGFIGCNPAWWVTPPSITTTDEDYDRVTIANLEFRNGVVKTVKGSSYLLFDIQNRGSQGLSTRSSTNHPLRISWRSLDKNCMPRTGWDTRRDLPFDIPAFGSLPMILPIEPAQDDCGIEISLVQELVFWGHDIGVTPLRVLY